MAARITILGAGFAGLELATTLSERLGSKAEITLVEHRDAFMFGFNKLNVLFEGTSPEKLRMPYGRFTKPAVRFLKASVESIDPRTKRVATDGGAIDADFLVVAMGADYDWGAAPGLVRGVNEFYTVEGAQALHASLCNFAGGRVVIGAASAPFKCPPAPSECAFLLHDWLTRRGVRGKSQITLVLPLGSPVPPSPDMSSAIIASFAELGIRFVPNRRVASIDAARGVAILDDGSELAHELFLGIPKHYAPRVVRESGLPLTENGFVKVDPRTLETGIDGVWAIGDVAFTGAPKVGVMAEGAAHAVASALALRVLGEGEAVLNAGAGTCYLEFGAGRVGAVDVDFFSGPKPTGVYHAPEAKWREAKEKFSAARRSRWFGM